MSNGPGTAVLRVRRAGPFVTVQDAGRPGLMRYGVPLSGPMDRFAHAAANRVLDQLMTATAIEVSLGGLTLECVSGAVTVGVCGGGFRVSHSGRDVGSWAVCTLRSGDTLAISAGSWGSWCYLAFAGELQAEQWLGSASTHVRSGLGGGTVQTGDELVVQHASVDDARSGPVDIPAVAHPTDVLRVVPGPTVRERDGLAMSSRNRYLTPERRDTALGVYRALQMAMSAQRPTTAEAQIGRAHV